MSRSELRAKLGHNDSELQAAQACHWYTSIKTLRERRRELLLQLEETVKAERQGSLKQQLESCF